VRTRSTSDVPILPITRPDRFRSSICKLILSLPTEDVLACLKNHIFGKYFKEPSQRAVEQRAFRRDRLNLKILW